MRIPKICRGNPQIPGTTVCGIEFPKEGMILLSILTTIGCSLACKSCPGDCLLELWLISYTFTWVCYNIVFIFTANNDNIQTSRYLQGNLTTDHNDNLCLILKDFMGIHFNTSNVVYWSIVVFTIIYLFRFMK